MSNPFSEPPNLLLGIVSLLYFYFERKSSSRIFLPWSGLSQLWFSCALVLVVGILDLMPLALLVFAKSLQANMYRVQSEDV
jgi:hypothetical protein